MAEVAEVAEVVEVAEVAEVAELRPAAESPSTVTDRPVTQATIAWANLLESRARTSEVSVR